MPYLPHSAGAGSDRGLALHQTSSLGLLGGSSGGGDVAGVGVGAGLLAGAPADGGPERGTPGDLVLCDVLATEHDVLLVSCAGGFRSKQSLKKFTTGCSGTYSINYHLHINVLQGIS